MTEQAHPQWDASYTAGPPAPWDTGRPQPAFARLADQGRLTGRLLDAGCGTGENALPAASRGADVTGIDVAPAAIARARAKAPERGLTARFEIAGALRPGRLSLTAGTVIDSGVFHVFGDDDRARYVASLAACAEASRRLLPHLLQRPAARDLGPAPCPRGRVARGVQRRLGRRVDYRRHLRDQPAGRHDARPGLASRDQAYLANRAPRARVPLACGCSRPARAQPGHHTDHEEDHNQVHLRVTSLPRSLTRCPGPAPLGRTQ
jgi:SAM-dependent methyltransferase